MSCRWEWGEWVGWDGRGRLTLGKDGREGAQVRRSRICAAPRGHSKGFGVFRGWVRAICADIWHGTARHVHMCLCASLPKNRSHVEICPSEGGATPTETAAPERLPGTTALTDRLCI